MRKMAEDPTLARSNKDLQKEAFSKVERWIELNKKKWTLEAELSEIKGELIQLEKDPAVQITKGAIRGAKRRIASDAPRGDQPKDLKRRESTVRKRLEKIIRQQENAPKNPNAGKKYPEDLEMKRE